LATSIAIAGLANRRAAQIAVPASQREEDLDFTSLGEVVAEVEIRIIDPSQSLRQVRIFRI
jgi:hypothetical protein